MFVTIVLAQSFKTIRYNEQPGSRWWAGWTGRRRQSRLGVTTIRFESVDCPSEQLRRQQDGPPVPPERTEFSLDPNDEEGTTSGATSGDDIWGTPTSGGPDDESFTANSVIMFVTTIHDISIQKR